VSDFFHERPGECPKCGAVHPQISGPRYWDSMDALAWDCVRCGWRGWSPPKDNPDRFEEILGPRPASEGSG